MKKVIPLIILILISSLIKAQENKDTWTDAEKNYYEVLRVFCQYLKSNTEYFRDLVLERFVEFDYVLKDTSVTRIKRRKIQLDTLVLQFEKYIDLIGLENLDAKPLRLYSPIHKIRLPFNGELGDVSNEVFAYYRKGSEDYPLGTIWFNKKNSKLISWILINQGGYYYFLTFNLL
ncbi:MAG: hypothetical protein ACKVOQ_01870 [Cyclobacteriaceae bacterium]